MTTTIEVTFENGILRPAEPLDWQEGERGFVSVTKNAPPVILPVEPPDPKRVSQLLAEIAAMPLEGKGEPFSGRDHDRILYGGPNGAL